jgi:TPR repeat protein
MLNVLKSLLNTYSVAANLVQANQLFDEARALYDAREYKSALPIMKAAAEKGSAHAASHLGIMYMKGFGVAPDWKEAADYLELAIIGKVPLAKSGLGMITAIGGHGLKRDIKKAVALLEESVQETGDGKDAEMLDMIQRKQGIFGQKEQARPKIKW